MQTPLLLSVLHVVWCLVIFLPMVFVNTYPAPASKHICVGIMLISQEREGLSKVTQSFQTPQTLGRHSWCFGLHVFFCSETNDKFRGLHSNTCGRWLLSPSRPNGLKRFWRPLRKTMLDSNPLSNPSQGENVYEIVHSLKDPERNSSQLMGQDSVLVMLVLSAVEEYHRARARWESGRIIADSTGWGSSQMMTWRFAANGFHLSRYIYNCYCRSSRLKHIHRDRSLFSLLSS